MKTSLAHLPEQKQQALALLVEKLQEAYPMGIRSIILFGSHARGTWVEEKAPDGVRYAYQSDFDVFIVTDTAQRAARIEGDIPLSNRLSVILRTPVSIIAHDGLFFNRRLRKAQYFFADIKKEGICLFDDSSFELAEAKELSPKERQHLAQESFDYWFQSAEEFYKGFNFYLKSGFLSKAAFSLHQVVECLYTTILLVYTNYKLNCHDLKKLTKLVVIEDMKFSSVFPQKTDEQKYRFKLLCKAYKDARYSRGYKITDKELLWLAERIKKLLTLTNHMCRRKIKNFS